MSEFDLDPVHYGGARQSQMPQGASEDEGNFRRRTPDRGLEPASTGAATKPGLLSRMWKSFSDSFGLKKLFGDGTRSAARKAAGLGRGPIRPFAKRSWMSRLFGATKQSRGLPTGMAGQNAAAGSGWADALVNAREGGWDADDGSDSSGSVVQIGESPNPQAPSKASEQTPSEELPREWLEARGEAVSSDLGDDQSIYQDDNDNDIDNQSSSPKMYDTSQFDAFLRGIIPRNQQMRPTSYDSNLDDDGE